MIKIVPTEIDFGSIQIGHGVEKEFIIYNNSGDDIAIQQISIISETPRPFWQFKFYTRQPSPGEIVYAGSYGRIVAYYMPMIIGSATAQAKIQIDSLSIAQPDSAELIINAKATAIPPHF
jgi:hypothetical protein